MELISIFRQYPPFILDFAFSLSEWEGAPQPLTQEMLFEFFQVEDQPAGQGDEDAKNGNTESETVEVS
jgi:hypothetical protein